MSTLPLRWRERLLEGRPRALCSIASLRHFTHRRTLLCCRKAPCFLPLVSTLASIPWLSFLFGPHMTANLQASDDGGPAASAQGILLLLLPQPLPRNMQGPLRLSLPSLPPPQSRPYHPLPRLCLRSNPVPHLLLPLLVSPHPNGPVSLSYYLPNHHGGVHRGPYLMPQANLKSSYNLSP